MIYVDGKITYNIPSSTDSYVFSSGSCTNDVTVTWDSDAWSANVHFSTYNNTNSNSSTKCILNFETPILAASYIKSLYIEVPTDLAYDDTDDENLRYIGADPNNYIDIGDNVLWRIIGVFEVDDGSGNTETRLKIIRSESIGTYSWDSSDSNTNYGFGVNEWSEADLMKLLNDGYSGTGGSLYWNNSSGTCYSTYRNGTKTCDFTSTGLATDAQEYFDYAVWHLGSNAHSGNAYTSGDYYDMERSNYVGAECGGDEGCNDTVTRTTSWTGKLALMYPSDYGFATSGGSTTDRDTCLSVLYNWGNYSDCYSNDWLYTGSKTWSLTPSFVSGSGSYVFSISSSGGIASDLAYSSNAVYPVGYLSSSVTITNGDGSESSPFIVSLN